MLSALSHDCGLSGGLLLSVKTMEGQFTSLMTVGAVTSVRLFCSNVNPCPSQLGASAGVPLFARVRTTTVEPALKSADGVPAESPKMLNSVSRHPALKSGN